MKNLNTLSSLTFENIITFEDLSKVINKLDGDPSIIKHKIQPYSLDSIISEYHATSGIELISEMLDSIKTNAFYSISTIQGRKEKVDIPNYIKVYKIIIYFLP